MIDRLRSDRLFRDSLMVMAATMASNAFVFLFYFLMQRQLGVIFSGKLYALVSLTVLGLIPASILNNVIVKFAAETQAGGDPAQIRALAGTIGRGFVGLAAVYVLVGALGAVPIAGFLHVGAWEVVISALVTIGFAFSYAARSFIQGRHDFAGYSIATTIDGICRVLFGVSLVAVGLSVAGGLGGLLAAGILGFGFSVTRIAPLFRAGQRARLRIDWRRVGITTYGSAIATACVSLLSYADIEIVTHFFNAHAAGIYSAVSLDGKIMFFLVNFAPIVLLPKVVERFSRGERTRGTLFGVLGLVVGMSLIGLMVFAFEPRLIVDTLNTAKFAEAIPYLWGYAGAMALLGLTNVLATYAIGIHRMAFAPPLLIVSIVGLAAIWFYHPSIGAVVGIVVAVNAVALLAVAVAVALGGPTATAALEPAAVPPVG